MKPLQNSTRRGGNLRGGGDGIPSTIDGRGAAATVESTFTFGKSSPTAIFYLLIHGICCAASLFAGFRISRILFVLLVASPNPNIHVRNIGLESSPPPPSPDLAGSAGKKSGVVVGRHGILIRPWPHPNPAEVMKAHQILKRVQQEQRFQYAVKSNRRIIAVTPTYVRTFQAVHLSGVLYSLMAIPYDVTWIVVEAGGAASDETAALFRRRAGMEIIHTAFPESMPAEWAERHRMEVRMRLHALRIIRDKKLDGIVVFMDDSNIHGSELFDEIQSVKIAGAISIGILAHPSCAGLSCPDDQEIREGDPPQPTQGPSCNSSRALIGLHSFNSLPYAGSSAVYVGEQGVIVPMKLEWSGFVLSSSMLWKNFAGRPSWFNDLDTVMKKGEIESPLALFNDISHLEPLGDCGKKIALWWLRAEARSDSQFPSRWKMDTPLEVTASVKRTKWPEVKTQAKLSPISKERRQKVNYKEGEKR